MNKFTRSFALKITGALLISSVAVNALFAKTEDEASAKLEALSNLLSDYEVLELARTGLTALSRGSDDVVVFN